ncbi:MAG: transcription antitermination factor NusB [Caulobacteraceae bacterium]
MEVSGVGVEAVLREFADHRFGRDLEDRRLADADEGFFAELVRGVVDAQAIVDSVVGARLAKNWRLERLDATVRAILRAGAFELMRVASTPSEVAIDEYVEIAKSFFEGPEPGFINAALDRIAHDERTT